MQAYKVIDIYIVYAKSEKEADYLYRQYKKENTLASYLWRHFASPVKGKSWGKLVMEQVKFW